MRIVFITFIVFALAPFISWGGESPERNVEEQAVEMVESLLNKIQANDAFTAEDDLKYFRGSSLLIVLAMQNKILGEDGSWNASEKKLPYAMLGPRFLQKKEIFVPPPLTDKTVIYIPSEKMFYTFVVVVYTPKDQPIGDFGMEKKRSKIIIFALTSSEDRPAIEIEYSSVDGISLPYLLGARKVDNHQSRLLYFPDMWVPESFRSHIKKGWFERFCNWF